MKKQLFLLTSLLIASSNFYADSCKTACKTSCTKKTNCKDVCVPEHGKTFRRVENTFQNATPVYASQFNSNVVRNLDADDKHGGMEITVFGGKNTKQAASACYFFPYGHSQYTFDGSVTDTVKIHARAEAFSGVGAYVSNQVDNSAAAVKVGTVYNRYAGAPGFTDTNGKDGYIQTDPVTFKFDSNKDTSKILPWNFGITFAALFEPQGALGAATGEQLGAGLVTSPTFKATVNPEHKFSHVGAGLALRYHFSDDKQGFFGSLSTSVEHVRSKICLNETPVKAKTEINSVNFPETDSPVGDLFPLVITASETPGTNPVAVTGSTTAGTIAKGSIFGSYINKDNATSGYTATTTGTYFPVNEDGLTNGGGTPPADVTEAFAQAAWNYGKIDCEQKITRLADIELAVGYQWLCSDCASSNWYVGVVIPTGNKPCAEYVAPAVVGNGQHGGIMGGSSLELMLSENEDRSIWYRLDTNCRYLFRNTQKRSFDLKGNEWSRYMMVWKDQAAYEAALTDVANNNQPNRNYTPGINVFTHDMKVKPRFQSRINQAVYFNSECFRAELGWNVFARTKECVEFSCPWDSKPAFADASYATGVGLNNNRTIYNDAQLMSVNQALVPNGDTPEGLSMNTSVGFLNGETNANALISGKANYEAFAITDKDVNLDSAATPASIVHTPYASLGYAWDSECKPAVSVGAQYEFSQGNTALQKWMVWGKFEFAF